MSLKSELIARIRGRAEMNLNTAGDHGPNGYYISMARRDAYNTAILDIEAIMTDDTNDTKFLQRRIDELQAAIYRIERRESPMITLNNGNGHIAGPMLTISENVHKPAKDGDVGYNLVSSETVTVRRNEVCYIKTGVKVKIPDGYWGIITARSSAVFKHQIHVLSGIIDNGYVGELMVACIAVEQQKVLVAGTSIAQLILFPIVTPHLELVEMLPETERGESGFGSTGKTGLEHG